MIDIYYTKPFCINWLAINFIKIPIEKFVTTSNW